MIARAKLSDAKLLSEIAIISKAFWGYKKEDLQSWVNDLTVTDNMIIECDVYQYAIDSKTVGFYVLNPPEKENSELEMLFVLPAFIGKGIGKQLLLHAFEKAKTMSSKTMTLLADPNAVPFYESQDFIIIDKKESSIAGRFLPVMLKYLN